MPTLFREEFREEVGHVGLNRASGVTLAQITKECGIHTEQDAVHRGGLGN